MKAKLFMEFFGSLWPYIFPKHEFKPKRLAGVLIIGTLLLFGIDYFGLETVEHALGLAEDVIDMSEE